MHIGVDVRNLTSPSVTGIARVLLETVRALGARGVRFTFFWPGKRRSSLVDDLDARHVESMFSSEAGRLIWGEAALSYAVRRVAPDVFWGPAHRLPPSVSPSIPTVVTIHDLVWRRFPETMPIKRRLADRALMSLAIRRADRVVAVSHATARDIEDLFGQSNAIVVYPGARRLTSSTGSTERQFEIEHSPYALFVGTLEPRKNLPRLLEAFDRARAEAKANWRLVVAGGKGWLDNDIHDALAPLVADGSVVLTGRLRDDELATLYAGARFVAMPSLYEGFGLPIVEAQLYGVPVLAGRAGSLPEVTGAAGILVDPRDVGEIAQGITRLFADDQLHAALAAETRKNAEKFTWDETARGMISVFEDAMKHHPRRMP